MADDQVDILLQLQNLNQFVSETKLAGDSVESIGSKAEQASSKTVASARRVPGVIGMIGRAARDSAVGLVRSGGLFTSFFDRVKRGAASASTYVKERMRNAFHFSAGGTLAGIGLSFLSVQSLKNAVNFTQELGVISAHTAEATGMTTQSLSALFAVAQANGVSMNLLGLSLKNLSTNVYAANKGTASSIDLFNKMGISMKDIRATGGNMQQVLGLVVDKFDKMPAGVNKTYIASHLFGRSWQQLLPVLGQGTKALSAQEKEARQLGVTLSGDPVKAALQLHDAQVKLKLAGMGLQVFIATKLLPIFIWLVQHMIRAYGVIKTMLGPAFHWIGGMIATVTHFLGQHKDILGSVTTAMRILAPAIGAVVIATLAWNIALRLSPLILIATLIIGLVAAIIYAWKHSQTFRDVILSVWNAIKSAFQSALPVIKSVWQGIVSVASWAWNSVLKPIFKFIWNVIKNVLVPVFKFLWQGIKTAFAIIKAVVIAAWQIIGPILKILWNFINGILIPVFKVLWEAVKGAFNVIGTVVSFVWQNILHPALSGIQGAFTWIQNTVGTVGKAIGSAFSAAGKVLTWIYDHTIKPIVDAIRWVQGVSIGGSTTSIAPSAQPFVNSQPPGSGAGHRAYGGPIWTSGAYFVGERGPEVLQLPKGSRVTPLSPVKTRYEKMDTHFDFNLQVPVVVDKREVARAVASFRDERMARR